MVLARRTQKPNLRHPLTTRSSAHSIHALVSKPRSPRPCRDGRPGSRAFRNTSRRRWHFSRRAGVDLRGRLALPSPFDIEENEVVSHHVRRREQRPRSSTTMLSWLYRAAPSEQPPAKGMYPTVPSAVAAVAGAIFTGSSGRSSPLHMNRALERPSLTELKAVNATLIQAALARREGSAAASGAPPPPEASIIEASRRLAELLVFAEQLGEEAVVDAFFEQQMLPILCELTVSPKSSGDIRVQTLQTLSILVQSVKSPTNLYTILSQNTVNQVLSSPIWNSLHEDEEEIATRFVGLLKTLALRLDDETLHFFYEPSKEDRTAFPLLTSAARFFAHPDGMIRNAVRTIVLQCLSVCSKNERGKAFVEKSCASLFDSICVALFERHLKLKTHVLEWQGMTQDTGKPTEMTTEMRRLLGKIENAFEDQRDDWGFLDDALNTGEATETALSSSALRYLFVPTIAGATHPETIRAALSRISLAQSLFVIARSRVMLSAVVLALPSWSVFVDVPLSASITGTTALLLYAALKSPAIDVETLVSVGLLKLPGQTDPDRSAERTNQTAKRAKQWSMSEPDQSDELVAQPDPQVAASSPREYTEEIVAWILTSLKRTVSSEKCAVTLRLLAKTLLLVAPVRSSEPSLVEGELEDQEGAPRPQRTKSRLDSKDLSEFLSIYWASARACLDCLARHPSDALVELFEEEWRRLKLAPLNAETLSYRPDLLLLDSDHHVLMPQRDLYHRVVRDDDAPETLLRFHLNAFMVLRLLRVSMESDSEGASSRRDASSSVALSRLGNLDLRLVQGEAVDLRKLEPYQVKVMLPNSKTLEAVLVLLDGALALVEPDALGASETPETGEDPLRPLAVSSGTGICRSVAPIHRVKVAKDDSNPCVLRLTIRSRQPIGLGVALVGSTPDAVGTHGLNLLFDKGEAKASFVMDQIERAVTKSRAEKAQRIRDLLEESETGATSRVDS